MARKKKDEQTGLEQGGDFRPSRLRAVDVQQIEFRVSMRGYNETEVDEFLDRVTEELVTLNEENKRLREGAVLPGMDTSAASAEAQAIIRDAQMQAEAILAGARAGTAGGGEGMSAIYPFLTKEREFLSALGEMVRAHMDGIKADARALQEASKAAAAKQAEADASAPAPEAAPAQADAAATEVASEPQAPAPEPPAPEEPTAPKPVAGASAWEATAAPAAPPSAAPDAPPVPEPEVAAIPPSDVDTPKQDDDEEPSLRDLFWGDE